MWSGVAPWNGVFRFPAVAGGEKANKLIYQRERASYTNLLD